MDHRTAPPPTSGGTERLLLAIGHVSATHRTVLTPAGSAPVNAVSWSLREEPTGRRVWPARPGPAPDSPVRLVVTVTGPGWQHTERFEAAGAEEVTAVRAKVTQARMLALRAVVWATADPRPAESVAPRPASTQPAGAGTTAARTSGTRTSGTRSTDPVSTGPSALPLPAATVRVLTAQVRGEVTEPAR